MYISENTVNEIQKLVHEAFLTNSKLDRVKTCLNADLAYPKTSNLVHLLAHRYGRDMGDGIGDLIENYNIPVIYGDISLQNKSYLSVKEALAEVLKVVEEFHKKLEYCAKVAFDNNDMMTGEGLLKIIKKHSKYLEQAILWKDLIDRYSNEPSFDAHIEQYDILN